MMRFKHILAYAGLNGGGEADRSGVSAAAAERYLRRQLVEREAELARSEAARRAAERRLHLAADVLAIEAWDYDAQAGQFSWSPNGRPLAPRTNTKTVHSEDDLRLGNFLSGGRDGKPAQDEFRFVGPDGKLHWLRLIAMPGCEAGRLGGIAVDISAQKADRVHLEALKREVDHRGRNLLAVVQSVLHLTKADSQAEFVATLGERIQALSRAHALLSNARWCPVRLRQIVQGETAGHASGGRVATNGPDVAVDPTAAQALVLVVHELAANARRHGALAVDEGRVDLTWSVDAGVLSMVWCERAPGMEPARGKPGPGTRMIEACVGQLGGRATFDWRHTGLCVGMILPQALSAADGSVPASKRSDLGATVSFES